MAYTPKAGQFALFKNDKGGNESRPDYVGDGADLQGNPIKVSAWLKEGKAGKFMSCSMQPKNTGQVPKEAKKEAPFASDKSMPDDQIPF